MKKIITIGNQQYEIESTVPLSDEQLEQYALQKINNMNSDIVTLGTCPTTAKYVGQLITLTSTPTGGMANYTVTFRRNGVDLPGGSFTGVPEGTAKSMSYTLVAADSPSVNISVYITDSCPTGALSNTDQCVITVKSCVTPSCGFVVS